MNTNDWYPGEDADTDASGHQWRREGNATPHIESFKVPRNVGVPGGLRLDHAIIVPANAIAPGLPYSAPKILRWLTRKLDIHEQALGVNESDAAFKMYDLTLSPDDANLAEYGRQAERIFDQNGVDPIHVRNVFHLGGQLTVYKGKKIEAWCNARADERMRRKTPYTFQGEVFPCLHTFNNDANCKGDSCLHLHLPLDASALFERARLLADPHVTIVPTERISLQLYQHLPDISRFSEPDHPDYDEYFAVRQGQAGFRLQWPEIFGGGFIITVYVRLLATSLYYRLIHEHRMRRYEKFRLRIDQQDPWIWTFNDELQRRARRARVKSDKHQLPTPRNKQTPVDIMRDVCEAH